MYLSAFDPLYAPLVASWVPNDQQATWLAPGTPPPLTAQKVLAWAKPTGRRYLLWEEAADQPIGYAELNDMPNTPGQMWIGHFLVDPMQRRRGCGRRFAQALMTIAFLENAATDVLLVVFPENEAAIRCYRRAGLNAVGYESEFFQATGHRHRFLRMGISVNRFRSLLAAGQIPPDPPAMRKTISR